MLNTCESQKKFIKQSVLHNIRIDGRRNNSKRVPIIQKDVISHLPGSSYLYMEYENI